MSYAEGYFLSSDGTRLFHRRWDGDSPRAVCLVVHGLAEHSGRYERLAQILADRRFSVWALDHQGHGRSDGRRGDCRDLNQFVEDLRALAGHARIQAPNLPHLVIGHSLGGLIALTYAARFSDSLRAVAVSSPALKLTHETPPLKTALVTGIARLIPLFPFPNGVNPQHLSHDPCVVEAYQKDPLITRSLTARCAVALNRAMKGSPALARRLKVPCLILQAGSDEVCDPDATARFARSVKEAPVTFRRYDGMYHELFNETERERVIFDLCTWLEKILENGQL